jgi:hypothetical protein
VYFTGSHDVYLRRSHYVKPSLKCTFIRGSLHLNVVIHDGDQYCNCAVVLIGIFNVAHLHALGCTNKIYVHTEYNTEQYSIIVHSTTFFKHSCSTD